MNQSALIGGALIAGFVLWIARQDRLSSYARVFFGSKPDAHATGPAHPGLPGQTDPGQVPSVNDFIQMGKDLAQGAHDLIPAIPGFGH